MNRLKYQGRVQHFALLLKNDDTSFLLHNLKRVKHNSSYDKIVLYKKAKRVPHINDSIEYSALFHDSQSL